jgi:hypothetical protein
MMMVHDGPEPAWRTSLILRRRQGFFCVTQLYVI